MAWPAPARHGPRSSLCPGAVRSWASLKGDDALRNVSKGWLASATPELIPPFPTPIFPLKPVQQSPFSQRASLQHPQALLGHMHAGVCSE